MVRFRLFAAVLVGIQILSSAALAQAGGDDGLKAFLDAYRCAMTDRLAYLHQLSPKETDRFIVVELADTPTSYAQCLFLKDNRTVFCEAASGYYIEPVDTPRTKYLSAESKAVLKDLGFSMDDSKSNFRRTSRLPRNNSYDGFADLLLTIMYRVYGARMDTKLAVETPLLGEKDSPLLKAACEPLS